MPVSHTAITILSVGKNEYANLRFLVRILAADENWDSFINSGAHFRNHSSLTYYEFTDNNNAKMYINYKIKI